MASSAVANNNTNSVQQPNNPLMDLKKETNMNSPQANNGNDNNFAGPKRGGGKAGGPGRGGKQFVKQQPKRPFQPNASQQGNRQSDDSFGKGNKPFMGPKHEERMMMDKLAMLSGPTIELPIRPYGEYKFSGRSRLYVGNLSSDVSEQDLKDAFTAFGEVSEVFLNKEKGFAFVRLDYVRNAERAKSELDGKPLKGRTLRVRSAPHSAAVKVKNLSPFVTNELLEKAFSIFGDIERAVVIANEKGQSTGEGIVEFVRKPGALSCIKRCSEGCFFVTSSLRPVVVEPMEQLDDLDGFSERSFVKKSGDFIKEREVGPRFADPNSFDFQYGQRWKQLVELFKQKKEALEKEMKMEEEKLIAQMEIVRYEHETEMLRDQLRQREMDRERQKRDWEMKERQREEMRLREEEAMRRQEEEMQQRLRQQEEDMRRRHQENNSFMEQFQQTGGFPPPMGGPGPRPGPNIPPSLFDRPQMPMEMEDKAFHGGFNRPLEPPPMFMQGGRMDGPPLRGPGPGPEAFNNAPRWGGRPDRERPDRDDFQHKRRRF